MKLRIIAIVGALTVCGAALAQGTAPPGASPPTPTVSGAGPAGSAAGAPNGLHGAPSLNGRDATGAVQPEPDGRPNKASPSYAVPNHPPLEPGSDTGSTAGKSNPD